MKTGRRLTANRLNIWTVVICVILLLLLLFIVYPVSHLVISSFFRKKTAGFTFANYVRFFTKKYYQNALLNSLRICVCTTVIAVALGVPLAYLNTRYNIFGKKILNIMIVISMLSPPFIGAYSWILLLGRNGFLTTLLTAIGIRIGSIYGFKGILLVFSLKLFPYVYLYVSSALGSIDSSLEEASESLGVHGLGRLLKMTFPLILPTILSSALIVFMTSLADFGTPQLIGQGYKVLPVAIYEEYMSEVGGDTSFASALSVVIVLIATLILLIQNHVITRRSYNMTALRPPAVIQTRGWRRVLVTLPILLVACVAMLPQVTVVVTSFMNTRGAIFVEGWSFASYQAIFYKLGRYIRNTFLFASISIVIIMILGLLVSYVVVRRRSPASRLIDVLIMFPYVIPGAVLGITLISAFNREPLLLTGTMWIMILSFTIRKIPFTLRSCIGILYQIDPSVEEASITLGVPPIRTFFKTTVHLMMPGLLSGAVLSFIATINELSSSLMLYAGRTGTVSVAIYSEVAKDGYGTAAALSSILILSTVVLLLIFNRISGGKSVID